MCAKRNRGDAVPYGYVRYSTFRPEPLADQVRAIFELASRGVPIKMLAVDFAHGRHHDRPGLRHLLEAARRGLVSEVVVVSLSRLARSRVDLTRLLRRFDKYGVRVTSVFQGTR